ncbi:hypothetical protein EIP91_004315 [Steccherinum ochraceum]|uniref:Uncharacterized protein n=1 Tax=Steccherinum ochraceum TaxID=92696 RepID=A0A4R0RBH7_9APHY|nr:hypothetical protein EIP91_004315 [Steccherinum ochraceum]
MPEQSKVDIEIEIEKSFVGSLFSLPPSGRQAELQTRHLEARSKRRDVAPTRLGLIVLVISDILPAMVIVHSKKPFVSTIELLAVSSHGRDAIPGGKLHDIH